MFLHMAQSSGEALFEPKDPQRHGFLYALLIVCSNVTCLQERQSLEYGGQETKKHTQLNINTRLLKAKRLHIRNVLDNETERCFSS